MNEHKEQNTLARVHTDRNPNQMPYKCSFAHLRSTSVARQHGEKTTDGAFALGSGDQVVELNHGKEWFETNNSASDGNITIRHYKKSGR